MRLQGCRRSRKMITGFLLGLWLCASPGSGADELVFASIEKTPITRLAERLLSRAYDQLGYTINVRYMPSRRALVMANSGRVDGELFRVAGVERAFPNLIAVPYPLIRGRLMVVTLDQNLTDWSPALLARSVVGVRRGIIVAERAADGMQTILFNDFEQMLELLKAGRIDVGLVSEVEGVSSMTAAQQAQVTILKRPLSAYTLYHYLNHKHRELVQPLAAVFQRLTETGEFRAIVKAAQSP